MLICIINAISVVWSFFIYSDQTRDLRTSVVQMFRADVRCVFNAQPGRGWVTRRPCTLARQFTFMLVQFPDLNVRSILSVLKN